MLDWLLILEVVLSPIGCAPARIEVISVGMKIIPGSEVCPFCELAFVERSTGTVGAMRHSEGMLIEGCNRYHFLVVPRMREAVLNKI